MSKNAPIDYKLRMKIYTISINLNLSDYILFITGGKQGEWWVSKKIRQSFQSVRPEHTPIPKDWSRYKCMCFNRCHSAISNRESYYSLWKLCTLVPPRDYQNIQNNITCNSGEFTSQHKHISLVILVIEMCTFLVMKHSGYVCRNLVIIGVLVMCCVLLHLWI